MDYVRSEKQVCLTQRRSTERKRLLAFRIAFRGHVGQVRHHLPDFKSEIMVDRVFWNIDYVDLMQKLQDHADKLRSLAQTLESSF